VFDHVAQWPDGPDQVRYRAAPMDRFLDPEQQERVRRIAEREQDHNGQVS